MATPNNRPNLADTINNLYFSNSEEVRLEAAKYLVEELGKSEEIKKTPLYKEALSEENLLKLPKPELTPPGKPGYMHHDAHKFSDEFKKFAEVKAKEQLQLKNEDQPDKLINYLVAKQLELMDGYSLKDSLVNTIKCKPNLFSKEALKDRPEEAEKAIEEYEKFASELEKTGNNINDQNQRLQMINFMMSGMTDENGQPIPMEEVVAAVTLPTNQQKDAPLNPQEIQGIVIQKHKAKEEEDKLKAAGAGVPIFDEPNNNALTGKSNQAPSAGEQSLSRPSPPSSGMS